MQFSSAVLSAAVAGSAVASFTNSTATVVDKTTVTITSCEDHVCTEVPVVTGVTTVTLDSTIYTTYCPLPSSVAPQSSAPASKNGTSSSAAPSSVASVSKGSNAAGLAASGLAAVLAAGLSFVL